ncbi:MAG: hypothetical protein Q7S36_00100 [Candidatus Liptonbacteria bacterium]|nr:hypothetical protein [Candidatus Liptonbacteria bacterium]
MSNPKNSRSVNAFSELASLTAPAESPITEVSQPEQTAPVAEPSVTEPGTQAISQEMEAEYLRQAEEAKSLDLSRPVVSEAWQYLTAKSYGKGYESLRRYVRFSALQDAAEANGQPVPIEGAKGIVRPGAKLVCGVPSCGKEFTEVETLVITKDVYEKLVAIRPEIPGLSPDVARIVARHEDGTAVRMGSHLKTAKGDYVPFCGSRFFVRKGQPESTNQHSHLGAMLVAAKKAGADTRTFTSDEVAYQAYLKEAAAEAVRGTEEARKADFAKKRAELGDYADHLFKGRGYESRERKVVRR